MNLLRSVLDSDHKWLLKLHNDPVVLRNVTDPTPIRMCDHMLWWYRIINDSQERRFIFCDGRHRIGFTKFYKIDIANNNCVLGADICKEHRGKGFAVPMWTLMLDKCFSAREKGGLGLHRVSLTTAEFNEAGIHVYKKLGFLEEGRMVQSLLRDGKYYDQICMCMFKPMWDKKHE